MLQDFRNARLDKLDSSTDSWTIFAIKNILLVNKVRMKVINNYNASTSNFALPSRSSSMVTVQRAMGVKSAATTRAFRNHIGAYTRGPASWSDSAVHVNQERNLFIYPLVGAASQLA